MGYIERYFRVDPDAALISGHRLLVISLLFQLRLELVELRLSDELGVFLSASHLLTSLL